MEKIKLTKNEITLLIDKILEQIIGKKENSDSPIDNKMNIWEWESGVALFAIYLYYRETKQKKTLLDYIVSWFDSQFAKGPVSKNVNTVCPLLTLTFLYEETKNEKYLTLCKEWLHYIMHDMPRTEENGIQHRVANSENGRSIVG